MGEKKGFTVKLIYDFPTQKATEVFEEGIGWFRVTCNRFRSFNGPRRICHWNDDGTPDHKEYNGPVYMFETNHIYKGENKGYIYPQDYVRKSRPRPGEGHLV
jgi:hypothetical protein